MMISARPGRPWCPERLPLLLFLLALFVYLPYGRHGFIKDDYDHIVGQPPLRTPADVGRLFLEPHTPARMPYYRPVTRLTYLLQKTLHGNDPAPFHLLNALLAGVAAALAGRLLSLPVFGLWPGAAFTAAAFFMLHPAASAAVHWIAARDVLLPGVLVLAAFVFFLQPGRRCRRLALAMFVLALFSREQSLAALPVFAAAAWLRAPAARVRAHLATLLPFGVAVLGYLAVRALVLGGAAGAGPLFQPRLFGWSFIYALQTVFVPYGRLLFEPPVSAWFAPERFAAALAALLLLVFALRRRPGPVRRQAWFWTAWALCFYLPAANVFYMGGVRFAERFLFLSLLAPAAVAVTVFLPPPAVAGGLRVRRAAAGTLVALCAIVSLARGFSYRDEYVFSRRWLAVNPASPVAHNRMGFVMAGRGDPVAAGEHFRLALQHHPEFFEAHNNLGYLHLVEGDIESAIAAFEAALAIAPDFYEAWNNLGIAHAERGDLPRALSCFETAWRLNPRHPQLRANLEQARREQALADDPVAAPSF